MASKPRVFIGSSVGGISVAAAIHENLKHNAEVTPWNQGAFELSKTTIESLTHALDTSDFGIFVFSRDDVVNLKGKRYSAVRDNVLFELGLFIGRLGRERTFIVAPDDADAAKEIKLRIPTDLVGITLGTFESSRTDGNLIAATGSFSSSVKTAIASLGRIYPNEVSENTVDNRTNSVSSTEPEQQQMPSVGAIDWAALLLNKKYDEALAIITKLLREEKDSEAIANLKLGEISCNIAIDPAKGNKDLHDFYESNKDKLSITIKIIEVYLDKSYFKRALVIVQEALQHHPGDYQLIILKSKALNALGRTNEATALLESGPENVKTALRLISVLEDNDEYDRAFIVAHQAYIKYPDSDEIMTKLIEVANSEKTSEKDNEILLFIADKLSHKYPDNGIYSMNVGFACLGLGLYDLAMQKYKKAEETIKEQWVYTNIGSLFRLVGLHEEAKSYFKKALSEEDNSVLAFTHTKMSQVFNSQEEDWKKYLTHYKNGRRKASIEPSYAALLPPLEMGSPDE